MDLEVPGELVVTTQPQATPVLAPHLHPRQEPGVVVLLRHPPPTATDPNPCLSTLLSFLWTATNDLPTELPSPPTQYLHSARVLSEKTDPTQSVTLVLKNLP